jgi:hypothetical protein
MPVAAIRTLAEDMIQAPTVGEPRISPTRPLADPFTR